MQEAWVGRIPGEGNGCPLRHPGLENTESDTTERLARHLPLGASPALGAGCRGDCVLPQSSQLSPLLTILWNIPAINHPAPPPALNVLPQLFLLSLTPGSPGNCEAQRMVWWQGPWPGDQVVLIPNHH